MEVAELSSLMGKLPSQGNIVETTTTTTDPVETTTIEVENTETLEEIQTKLDELGTKPETDLTDVDKEYIKKYTSNETTDDEITSIRKEIETSYGLTLETKYENGPEGLKHLVNDVAPIVAKNMFVNALEQIPYMKEFYEHVSEGKTIDTFLLKNSKPVFENIELKNIDETVDESQRERLTNNQKSIIQLDLKAKGLSDEDIDNLISLTEAKNGLFDRAKLSLQSLKDSHIAKVSTQLKLEEDRIETERLEGIKLTKQVDELITKNDFSGVSIPVADLKAFKEAMLKPVDNNGNTLLDYKRNKLTLDQRVLIDYFVFKDLKNLGLAKKIESSNKAFTFKKAVIENNVRSPKLTNVSDGKNQLFNSKDIDFTKLYKQ